MDIIAHQKGDIKIAEVNSEHVLIGTPEEGLQLLVDLYYQGFDKVILREAHLNPRFFDLSTGFAGEVLQKFTNYRVALAIVGDFGKYPGKSLKDFIFESNKGRQVNFTASVEEALEKLG